MLANKLMSALTEGTGGTEEKLYVDDVFSTYLYTGNGSTQAINNGIDLAGEGGLVWIKGRAASFSHVLVDTLRGRDKELFTNSTSKEIIAASDSDVTSFNFNGFTLGKQYNGTNSNGDPFVSWSFRKAPKFFDVVTYTGSTGSLVVNHALGQTPGMIVIKNLSNTTNWYVWHRSASQGLCLNSTATAGGVFGNLATSVNSTSFTVDINSAVNTSGNNFVAYLFAHDDSEDGIVQCGSFTEPANGTFSVELGWEPQFVMVKPVSRSGDWVICDTQRGWTQNTAGDVGARLFANTSSAENTGTNPSLKGPHATGFHRWVNWNEGTQYIYMAIRRPNKPPTSGVEVYNAIARTGNSTNTSVNGLGFSPDLVLSKCRGSYAIVGLAFDRLRGATKDLRTPTTNSEQSFSTTLTSFDQDGFTVGVDSAGSGINWNGNGAGLTYINHAFRRAPGFFDVVCYTGTGVARTVPHSLGVAPELMIVKSRSSGLVGWAVYPNDPAKYGVLNSSAGFYNDNTGVIWNSLEPTARHFSVGNGETIVNLTGATFVAYLFASLPGISKVGSYTGSGTTQTINCEFTTGARFILIKRTDTTGDWYVWDTARGIVAANDPHLSLNNETVEVTTNDSVDPHASGFIVNQVAATNINVSGGQYIFLAIA